MSIRKGQFVKVGTFSTGRVVHVFKIEDFKGFCTVAWGGGHTLELISNLQAIDKGESV